MSIPLTLGVEVDAQQQEDLICQCFIQNEKTGSTRLDIVQAANAITAFYRDVLDRELVYRADEVHKGDWMYWTGKYWLVYPEIHIRKDVDKLLGGIGNRTLTELIHTIEIGVAQRYNTFDAAGVVVFEDCCLGIRNGKLKNLKHKKDHFSTFYVPHTFGTTTTTPEWDKVLARTFPDAADRDALQEMCGYCFFPAYQAQVIFLMFGPGGTGKGTVTKVLAEMLGQSRVAGAKISSFGDSFGLMPLRHAYVNIDSEAEYLGDKAETMVKQISGGDLITINVKNKAHVSARLPVRLIMTCNDIPKFNDKSDALWQRLVVIPFDVPVPDDQKVEEDVLMARLRPELPGVLRWAMEGLLRVLDSGKTRSAAFTQSERARAILGEHRVYSDPWLEWFSLFVEKDTEENTSKEAAHSHYSHWAKRNGYAPVAENRFAQYMKNRAKLDSCKVGGRDNRTPSYRGIKLVPQAPPALRIANQ